MPHTISNKKTYNAPSFNQLWKPLRAILPKAPPLESRCNRPLQLDFEHQLKALIFFHLEEQALVQFNWENLLPHIRWLRQSNFKKILRQNSMFNQSQSHSRYLLSREMNSDKIVDDPVYI